MTEKMTNQQQKQYKVILIGDDGLDVYAYGEVKRISPEAPVPVFNLVKEEKKPGMAANVLKNLLNLGLHPEYYYSSRSTKQRIIDLHTKQHLLRIDDDVISEPLNVNNINFDCDAVLLSDYNKGYLTYGNMRNIIDICSKKQIPVFIDTKKPDLARFSGAFVKINETEYENAISLCEDLIVTRGSKDVLCYGKNYPVKDSDVVDVCGAGDTFIAAFLYKILMQGDIEEAIQFAIDASAVTVRKLGAYAPTLEEICQHN